MGKFTVDDFVSDEVYAARRAAEQHAQDKSADEVLRNFIAK